MVIADLIESIKLNCGITTHIYNAIQPRARARVKPTETRGVHGDAVPGRSRRTQRHRASRPPSQCYYLCALRFGMRVRAQRKKCTERTQHAKYVHFYLRVAGARALTVY